MGVNYKSRETRERERERERRGLLAGGSSQTCLVAAKEEDWKSDFELKIACQDTRLLACASHLASLHAFPACLPA
jgi:hypothetical protein